MLKDFRRELGLLANPEVARILAGFFKTGKGCYGEGDVFLGIPVPATRAIVRKYVAASSLSDVEALLASRFHEERLAALLLLVEKYRKAPVDGKKLFVDFYLAQTKSVNNWDLVDLSSHQLLGDYLLSHSELLPVLEKLAKSGSLWERRISIVSTYAFIRNGSFEHTFRISEILMNDRQDLIHKAMGWMLREVGKQDLNAEQQFLDRHYKAMPRTALRYAIERFDDLKKKAYMSKKSR